MAVKQLPDGRWMVYYNDPVTKKRKKEYFGRGPEAMARATQRDKDLGFRKGRPPKTNFGPTFDELADLYFVKKGFNRNPRETLSYRLTNINAVIGYRHAIALKAEHLDNYVDIRRQDGVKDNSIAREITDIKAILNWAAAHDPPLIPINPIRDYKAPRENDAVILPPEPDELQAIYEHACPHLKRFISLASYIGARPGAVEILSLRWGAVSWSSRSIRVISANKGGPPMRQVAIHDDFYPMLEKWYKEDVDEYGSKVSQKKFNMRKLHIVHYWGSRITTIKRAWKAALEGAGIIRRIRPYDLRHRFITLALENGADIGALADIVGSRPETLRKHYQHVTRELHRRTVNSIPGLGAGIVPKN